MDADRDQRRSLEPEPEPSPGPRRAPERGPDRGRGSGPEHGWEPARGSGPEHGWEPTRGSGPEHGWEPARGSGPEHGWDPARGPGADRRRDTNRRVDADRRPEADPPPDPDPGLDADRRPGDAWAPAGVPDTERDHRRRREERRSAHAHQRGQRRADRRARWASWVETGPAGRGWPDGPRHGAADGGGADGDGVEWWRRRRGRGNRFFLAILVAAVQLIGTNLANDRLPGAPPLDSLAYALLLAGPAALVIRRSRPLLAFAVALAATVGYLAVDLPRGPYFLAAIVALFSAARRARRECVWAIATAGYVGYVVLTQASHSVGGVPVVVPSPAGYVGTAVVGLVAVMFAEGNRIRGEAFREMARARAEAQRARQEQSRRQASDERLRIAQELHDELGHHLSLINVRAGVALHLIDSRPDEVREALDAIKLASAEALREVRGVLATLHPRDASAPRAPSHGLADIDRLAEEASAAALPVTVRREGPARPVPAEVERAAYRIVQEALTNVRRHAGPAAVATVTVGYAPGVLTIRVEDTGQGPPLSTSDGNGIPGMRERAAALGGSLVTGTGPEGGFRVEARLPTGSMPPTGPPPPAAPTPGDATASPPAAPTPGDATAPPSWASTPGDAAAGPPDAAGSGPTTEETT